MVHEVIVLLPLDHVKSYAIVMVKRAGHGLLYREFPAIIEAIFMF